MLFNTVSFFLFFLGFFTIFHFVTRTRALRLWLIIIGSLAFYCFWDYRTLPILLGTAFLDFYLAARIQATQDEKKKRRLVTLSVCANLAVLGTFKYAQFFLDSSASAIHMVGIDVSAPIVSLVLPIGISFYTFQSISYVVDVYRGVFTPRKRFLEFLGALTFFPHLVAGPIVRGSFILPQFETFRHPKWAACRQALLIIAFGLAKKTMADLLGMTADRIFDGTEPLSLMDSWTGILAFAGQVFGDFSGYTDIAIGLAMLLGFQLPKNFNFPYLSRTIVEFWARWHMTLSNWLQDYLYYPLAGRSPTRARVAIVITMLLAGIWHGAGWTFVAFGLYHGLLLLFTHVAGRATEDLEWVSRIPDPFKMVLTFYFVSIGFVLFRAGKMASVWRILRGMHAPTVSSDTTSTAWVVLALVLIALAIGHALDYLSSKTALADRPWILWPSIAVAVGFAMSIGSGAKSFIYFQF